LKTTNVPTNPNSASLTVSLGQRSKGQRSKDHRSYYDMLSEVQYDMIWFLLRLTLLPLLGEQQGGVCRRVGWGS
jgi:hypothetical protein